MKKIKLLKDHWHNGIALAAGTVIDVPDSTADFLIRHKVAEVSPEADAPKPK